MALNTRIFFTFGGIINNNCNKLFAASICKPPKIIELNIINKISFLINFLINHLNISSSVKGAIITASNPVRYSGKLSKFS